MKALEILKRQLAVYSDSTMRLLVTEHNEATAELEALQARIAELEALQAHLTCDGCIHQYIEFDGSGCRLCENYDLECARGYCVYCVDRYEPKGSK